jgi:hypothetical protein
MNATAVGPTAAGFVTIFPADDPLPTTSNLNFVIGSPPTPNQVTVGLSVAGAIKAFNKFGSVALIIDIVGYYQPAGAGAPGPKGDKGDTGSTGLRGLSAWDVIPSGQTVTGNFGVADSYAAGSYYQSISLPAKATAALSTAQINFSSDGLAATTDDDPACTGTAAVPTAPAGKLCMYLYQQSGSSGLNGFSAQNLGNQAFYIVWNVSSAGAAQMAFTWAYTAP